MSKLFRAGQKSWGKTVGGGGKSQDNDADVERVLILLAQGGLTTVLAQVSAGEIDRELFQAAFSKYQDKKRFIDFIETFAN